MSFVIEIYYNNVLGGEKQVFKDNIIFNLQKNNYPTI